MVLKYNKIIRFIVSNVLFGNFINDSSIFNVNISAGDII